MSVTTLKPVIPSFRHVRKINYRSVLSQGNDPLKSLTVGKRSIAGRNNRGRITMRHRGGGHKRLLRAIDFIRNKDVVASKVISIEYDPNRTCFISLLHYLDGEKRYILAPKGLEVGAVIESGPHVEAKVGNALPLRNIPMGAVVHNVEMVPGQGGKLVRSAGASAQLVGKEDRYAQIKMPSGEIRKVLLDCRATIGQVSNEEHANISLGKAGRSRNMGRRPRVRGKVMSPKDHPHGGGEGRNSIGMPSPKSKWGWRTLGVRTRKDKRSNKMIIKSRRQK